MGFVVAFLVALRVSLARRGFSEFTTTIRREREARRGRALSAEERLEHRGMVFILLGLLSFVGFFVAWGASANRSVRAVFVLAAIGLTLVGLGYYVASGLAHSDRR
jgi:hypothetical protein